MILTKISRSKSFETINEFGLKRWDRLNAKGLLSEGEDPLEGYKLMDEIMEEAHKRSLKIFSDTGAGNLPIPEIKLDQPEDKIKGMMSVIELTQNIPALERFKTQVDKANNTELTEYYNNKYKSLK